MSDIWDRANEATLGPKFYFGQVFTLGDDVYISKGEPKRLFDSNRDPVEKRYTQIKIDGQCTRANGSTYEISREIICEFGREWAGIILPSLKICGVHPRDLDQKWAKWEMVETGQSFVATQGASAGETIKKTTFKFLEIYPDEAACRAAEKAHYSRAADDEDEPLPMPEDGNEAPKSNGGNGSDAQRQVAAKFLPALLAQAQGDLTQFSVLLAGNPLTSKYFDLNSPEVLELVAQAA